MSLLTQIDFETPNGQKKIISTIHKLEQKVHELEFIVQKLVASEPLRESDVQA